MAKVSTKPPSGTRDFLPTDVARRRHVVDVVQGVYERYGFVPLETPAFENLEVLLGKYGEDEKLIYRLLHRGETLQRVLGQPQGLDADALSGQALRYDLTVPLARVVAQYGDLPRYFKRYQIQPVWRADRPGKGRYREFYQCDVDIIGTPSLVAEAEVTSALCEVLDRLGFAGYAIDLNHRQLLRALIGAAGIDPAKESTALVAVDKLAKIGHDGVLTELEGRGIARDAAGKLLDLLRRDESEDNATVLQRLEDAVGAEAGVADLRELVRISAKTPAGPRLRVMPALARGLSYYTGPIFEVISQDFGGSLGGGGRYDELVGMFGKNSIPAVGFSLGLERILLVMEEQGLYPELALGPEVLVCWRGVDRMEALGVATALRAQGLRAELFPEESKLGKQVQYADSIGAAFAGIVGEEELASGSVTLKHLQSGKQDRVPIQGAADHIRGS